MLWREALVGQNAEPEGDALSDWQPVYVSQYMTDRIALSTLIKCQIRQPVGLALFCYNVSMMSDVIPSGHERVVHHVDNTLAF